MIFDVFFYIIPHYFRYFLIGLSNKLTKWRTTTGQNIKNMSGFGKSKEIFCLTEILIFPPSPLLPLLYR